MRLIIFRVNAIETKFDAKFDVNTSAISGLRTEMNKGFQDWNESAKTLLKKIAEVDGKLLKFEIGIAAKFDKVGY